MRCPACKSKDYVKNGFTKFGSQRFLCKGCGKSFVLEEQPNNINVNTRLRNLLIKNFLDRKKVSLTDIKTDTNAKQHKQTIYYWRHKVLKELISLQSEIVLSGQIQIDEIYFPVNYKGNHKNSDFKLPREAHKRSGEAGKRGLSKEKMGVVTALNEHGVSIAIPCFRGRANSTAIYNALKNNIEPNSTLISDSTTAYNKLAKSLNLTHYKVPSGKHIVMVGDTKYHIQDLNNYHSRLRGFMSNFYGVTSKFLPEYVAWFAFIDRKDLSVEEKKKILTKIMSVLDLTPNRKINKIDVIPTPKKTRKKRTKKAKS